MTGVWRLDSLPSDVLILIFNYCHAFDLVRLSEVCTRFYDIIHDDTLWKKRSNQPLVTNQAAAKFRERCNPLLCLRKKWHVSHNWQYGRYKKKFIFSQKAKLMPWLQLTDDILWWSGGDRLCGFRRSEPLRGTVLVFNENDIGSDICKFVVKDEYIVSGHRDGSLKFWTKAKRGDDHICFSIDRAHSSDVNAVDKIGQIIVSGAGDGIVKVWKLPNRRYTEPPLASINVRDRIWSVVADPTGLKFAVGSSGNGDGPPLNIFDIECCSISDIVKHNWRRGAGILDMVWDNPYTLLTCGYDTYIRKWDMRCGMCVSSWADPTSATLYCISSDYQHTLVSGTQFNCKAVLWDQRQKHYIQLYFMNLRMSSPIYSISFDSCHLYGATDQHLAELTFSGYSYEEINYREMLTYEFVHV
ncbi:F-box/WD repeat-containing protein 4-like [Vespa mandarinia]|uniref:F-box/WD repeat-containing protein 4-like n=1 Tax=Vespa mandarinia TaxID=7446 RepID=UPI0016100C58|nr:F-box/WD repeat-containing protein 4-like [Vespa mandarinia]XP_046835830.1 F-box/WD repeat-containing protein 4 [Vespa crabro]XP_047365971.1 F-box/WD repeat-containing protein 4 [Vespa velutina]